MAGVDETWLSIGAAHRSVAVVLRPKGAPRLDLRLNGPILLALWQSVAQGGFWARFKPWVRLTRGLKTEAGALNFVRLMGQGMV